MPTSGDCLSGNRRGWVGAPKLCLCTTLGRDGLTTRDCSSSRAGVGSGTQCTVGKAQVYSDAVFKLEVENAI